MYSLPSIDSICILGYGSVCRLSYLEGVIAAMSKNLQPNSGKVLTVGDSSQIPKAIDLLASQRLGDNSRTIIRTNRDVVAELLGAVAKEPEKSEPDKTVPKASLSKDDRRAAPDYLKKPSTMFASISSMSQAWRLISSGEYPKLTRTLAQQASGMFTEKAAFLYLTALRDFFLIKRLKSMDRQDANNALLLLNNFVAEKAAIDRTCCKAFYRNLLNAMARSPRPNPKMLVDQTSAAAYYFWAEHNRNYGNPNPTPPHRVAPSLAFLYHLAGLEADNEALDLLHRIHSLLNYHVLLLKMDPGFRLPIMEDAPTGVALNWPGTPGLAEFAAWSVEHRKLYISDETYQMLTWIDDHRDLVAAKLAAMWEDITERPKRSLNPQGETIFVEGLAKECGHPVRILLNEDTIEHRVETALETCNIAPSGQPTYHGNGLEMEFLPQLMQGDVIGIINYMGDLVGYHRLICGDRQGPRISHISVPASTPYEGADIVRKIQRIGGHLTPLYGRRRSDDALINLKKERGDKATIPDDMTWVVEHKRRHPLKLLSGKKLAQRIGRNNVEPAVIVDMYAVVENLAHQGPSR